jgi:hypothetical protein
MNYDFEFLLNFYVDGGKVVKANCHHHHHHHHHHHNHNHHQSFTELGHLLTRSGLTYPEVSSKFYHDSFCQLGNSISLPWVIYFEIKEIVSTENCFDLWRLTVIHPRFVVFEHLLKHNLKHKMYKSFLCK